MTDLPQDAYIGNAARTEGEGQSWLEALRDFTAQLKGGQAKSELTIAAGVVTPNRYYHTVDTEADAASDNLDQLLLTALPDGSVVLLMAENAARVATLRHLNGTGTPGTNGEMVLTNDENFALDHALAYIELQRVGTQWIERRRSRVFGRRIEGAVDALAVRTLIDGQQATGSLTENTAPAVTDFLAMTVGGNHRKVQLVNAFNRITGLTGLTAIAIDDEILIYDLSGAIAKKITPVELLKVINALTEDTTPDLASDFVLTYDASAATVKKVKPNNLAAGLKPVATVDVTGLTTVDFEQSELFASSTEEAFFVLENIVPTTDAQHLWCRIKEGGAYKSGASDYRWGAANRYDSNTTWSGTNDAADAQIVCDNGLAADILSNAANESYNARIFCSSPAETSRRKIIDTQFRYISHTTADSVVFGLSSGNYVGNNNALQGFRFLLSGGGTFASGRISAFAIKRPA